MRKNRQWRLLRNMLRNRVQRTGLMYRLKRGKPAVRGIGLNTDESLN